MSVRSAYCVWLSVLRASETPKKYPDSHVGIAGPAGFFEDFPQVFPALFGAAKQHEKRFAGT
jgi:hypothetical protein